MLRMSSVTVHVLVRLLVKLGTALLIGPAGKCPIFIYLFIYYLPEITTYLLQCDF